LPHSRENILLNFKFKNKKTRSNLNANKRTLKWWLFWNKLYAIFDDDEDDGVCDRGDDDDELLHAMHIC